MTRLVSICLGILWPLAMLANAPPVVTNVLAEQLEGTQLVQVTYDVSDADNDTMTVSLQISSDAGVTWNVPVFTVSGDIGDGILSGVNFQILWNAGLDHAEHAGAEYKAKVIADDNSPRPESMVFVPATIYVMGSDVIGGASIPEHVVNVPAFYMDIYEVTNAQYKVFCDSTSRAYPLDPEFNGMPNYFTNPVYQDHPVVRVSWQDARDYATWAGRRQPPEAEWEYAAKGSEGNRVYPWGDTWVAGNANIDQGNPDGYTYTSPVGTFPNGISPAGCYDMAGNVYEWCEDDGHNTYNGAPTDGSAWIDDPRGGNRVIRGGNWINVDSYAQCASRNWYPPSIQHFGIGFRCARTP